MYKTITLRVSQEEYQQIHALREQHFQKYQSPISQSQLIRNIIKKTYQDQVVKEEPRKEELFIEKEEAHKRDLTILDRLRERRWGKSRS